MGHSEPHPIVYKHSLVGIRIWTRGEEECLVHTVARVVTVVLGIAAPMSHYVIAFSIGNI